VIDDVECVDYVDYADYMDCGVNGMYDYVIGSNDNLLARDSAVHMTVNVNNVMGVTMIDF
jgi:hypothetical protein